MGYFADGPWAHHTIRKIESNRNWGVDFICVRNNAPDQFLIQYAKEHDIDCLRTSNVNADKFLCEIGAYKSDIFVSMSFNQILKTEIINMPDLKTINCHAGKLPFYRGRNVLNWALINDEKEFGITVHYVDEGIDTGDIIIQNTYGITDADDYGTLLSRSYVYCAETLYEALAQIEKGMVQTIAQNTIDPVGFYCGRRQEGDEIIEWKQTSRELFNFIRAIARPGPMARSFIDGYEITINKAKMIDGAVDYIGICGQVVGSDSMGFTVKTKDSVLRITEYESNRGIRVGDRLG
jgi:methionyl-tRNA formyltransferase